MASAAKPDLAGKFRVCCVGSGRQALRSWLTAVQLGRGGGVGQHGTEVDGTDSESESAISFHFRRPNLCTLIASSVGEMGER